MSKKRKSRASQKASTVDSTPPATQATGEDKVKTETSKEPNNEPREQKNAAAPITMRDWLKILRDMVATLGVLITIILTLQRACTPDSCKFLITTPFASASSRITIELENADCFKDVPLHIKFDNMVFPRAAHHVPNSNPAQWIFVLREHTDDDSLLRDGIHTIQASFPNPDWSAEPRYNVKLKNASSIPLPGVKVKEASFTEIIRSSDNPDSLSFAIVNLANHPDSTFTILPRNRRTAQHSPLRIKFDDTIVNGLIFPQKTANSFYWEFSLKNKKVPPELRRAGAHEIQLQLATETDWSTVTPIVFQPTRPKTQIAESLPAPQFVDVDIAYGSDDRKLRLLYAIQTGRVLSYINGRTVGEITREANLKDEITETARQDLERLLQHHHKLLIAENHIEPVISKNNEYYEVRPIPIYLGMGGTQDSLTKPLYISMGFDQSAPPKLIYVRYDELANWFRLTEATSPLEANNSEYTRLRDFLTRFETAFNERDFSILRNAFVDSAEFVVGTESSAGVQFQTRDKETYFRNLQEFLKRPSSLNVQFSNFVFKRIPGAKRRYLVEFHLRWSSAEYTDEGSITWIIEMDEKHNILIIRESSRPESSLHNVPNNRLRLSPEKQK